MELNCALKLRWKKGQAVGGNYVSVGGHQGGKTAKNGLSASSTTTATLGNQSANHGHNYGTAQYTTVTVQSGSGNVNMWGGGPVNTATAGVNADHNHGFTAGPSTSTTVAGDNETRPVNRGVRYIIKA